MTVSTVLSNGTLSVVPGEEATTELRIGNTGDLVDQFSVDLVGAVGEWATVEPRSVNLMPGGEATVRVAFAPPRSAVPKAGPVPFGVRVRSREDPKTSKVEEGVVEVAAFTELVAELVPAKKRGSRKAKYRLAVENLGNSPVRTEVVAFDPEDDQLDLDVRPAEVEAAPGTVTIVRVRASAARRFLRGEPKPHPFELEVTGVEPACEKITVEGVMIQERLLPKWLLPMAIALGVAAVALVVLWFTVLVPKVQTIAEDQVQQQVSQANAAASEATEAAAAASQAADEATGGGGGGGDGAGGGGDNGSGDGGSGGDGSGGDGGGSADGGAAGSKPVDFRVATKAAPVTDGSYKRFTYTAPDGKALEIGDLVLQNPRGDSGLLRIVLGDDVLLEVGLANFRDLDYHYVDALHVEPDQPVVVEVNCLTPGQGAGECTPGVSFSGRLR